LTLWDTLTASLNVALWFSWVALLIATLPTIMVWAAAEEHRLLYVVVGALGSIAGGFCGAASLFLGLWFYCLGVVQGCNTAQGDMGLMITFPAGSLLGCFLSLFWMWAMLRISPDSPWAWVTRYSGTSRVGYWSYAIGVPATFLALITIFFAFLMGAA
jgi:hypothetical protein